MICSLAAQMAHTKGMVSLAGSLLNTTLADLCQTYDLAVALGTAQITLQPGGAPIGDFDPEPTVLPSLQVGCGPYPMPADYLRIGNNEAIYIVNNVSYVMVNCDLSEFDALTQQAGISNYPQNFTTDPSTSPVAMYVWPPAGGSYTTQIRYYRQMPDIATPETSTVVPWFPNTKYLITQTASEMMKVADDARWKDFAAEAAGILTKYLKLQSDDEGRAMTVKLDRRRFGSNFSRLPNTKLLGWSWLITLLGGDMFLHVLNAGAVHGFGIV